MSLCFGEGERMHSRRNGEEEKRAFPNLPPFQRRTNIVLLSHVCSLPSGVIWRKMQNIHSGNETKVLRGESICLRIEQSSLNCSKMIKWDRKWVLEDKNQALFSAVPPCQAHRSPPLHTNKLFLDLSSSVSRIICLWFRRTVRPDSKTDRGIEKRARGAVH